MIKIRLRLLRTLLGKQEKRMKNAFREKILKKKKKKLSSRLDVIKASVISNKTDIKNLKKEIIDVAVSKRFNEEIFENKISKLYKTTLEEKAD